MWCLLNKDLVKYNNEMNKRREDAIKKTKKKPVKGEEENPNEFIDKFRSKVKSNLMNTLTSIPVNSLKSHLRNCALSGNRISPSLIKFFTRLTSVLKVKTTGIEGKNVVLRIDMEEFEVRQEEVSNAADDEPSQRTVYDYSAHKDKLIYTMSFILENRCKSLLLICENGPKSGAINDKFSMRHFETFCNDERLFDSSVYFIKDPVELRDLNLKIENNDFTDNCVLILENINFFNEELGRAKDRVDKLRYLDKEIFVKSLKTGPVFVNDSVKSIMNKTITNCELKNDVNCIGLRINDQLYKLTQFFSIKNDFYTLLVGWHNDFEFQINLILNTMENFRKVIVFGKLAFLFLAVVHPTLKIVDLPSYADKFFDVIKFILVKSYLNDIEIVLPEDVRVLPKQEFEKFGRDENYLDFIKSLRKRVIKSDDFELKYSAEPEELENDPDYLEIKLSNEEKDILTHYNRKSISIESVGKVRSFVMRQNFKKPQKILKNEFEIFNYESAVYDEPTVMQAKDEVFNPIPDGYVIADFGSKTYDTLCRHLKETYNLMWIGTLSPTEVENAFEDYLKIVGEFNERKTSLRTKFNELVADDEKKPLESELRGRKHLFNIFLEGEKIFGLVKQNYKKTLDEKNGINEEEDAVEEDDDQLNFEMNNLIDYYLNDANEVIEQILCGKEIHGFHNITLEEEVEEEEEIDMRFLEEI